MQIIGILVQLHVGEVSANQHRQARHTSPSPEPTLEPTSFAAVAHVHVDSLPVSFDTEGDRGGDGSGEEIDENAFDNNADAWKAVPSSIADSARPPATTM